MMQKTQKNNLIYGKNPVFEVLNNDIKRVSKIYIQQGIFLDNRLKKIIQIAYDNKIIVQKTNLDKFLKDFDFENGEKPNFQGIIANIAPVEYVELEDFLKNKKEGFSKVIILDSVQDPYNFGAIIRTSVAAGFDAIIIQNHRSCPISAIVEKVSSGAINKISIIKTSSLSSAINTLKKSDFWVIATQMQAKDNYYEIDYTDMNFALVMGSEGSGISKTILNLSDFVIKIECDFESLNVSNAAAIIMFEALRQIKIKK